MPKGILAEYAVHLAGGAGGLIRTVTLRENIWPDGIITVVTGILSATYLGPAAAFLVERHVGLPRDASIASCGFIIGFGGVAIVGFIIDFMRAWLHHRHHTKG